MPQIGRVTHQDIALACGVSRATVRYVVNNVQGHRVSAATRDLVLRTARELGYVSNVLLNRLDAALAARGFVLLTDRYDETLRSARDLWQLVSPSLVVVMGGLTISEEADLSLEATNVLRVHGTLPNAQIGRMHAEYLAGKGHRALGYVLASIAGVQLIAMERLAGFRDGCSALGLPEPVVRTADAADVATVGAALDAFAAAGDVTAVATHNDEIGLLLVSALKAQGREAGRDLAIIGVDNIPSARIDLTTVEIEAERWGDDVVSATLAQLDDQVPQPVRVIERRTA